MTVCDLSYESTVLYLLIAMVCFVGSTNALVVVMLSTGLQRLFFIVAMVAFIVATFHYTNVVLDCGWVYV